MSNHIVNTIRALRSSKYAYLSAQPCSSRRSSQKLKREPLDLAQDYPNRETLLTLPESTGREKLTRPASSAPLCRYRAAAMEAEKAYRSFVHKDMSSLSGKLRRKCADLIERSVELQGILRGHNVGEDRILDLLFSDRLFLASIHGSVSIYR